MSEWKSDGPGRKRRPLLSEVERMNLRILSVTGQAALSAEIEKIGLGAARLDELVAKAIFQVVKLEDVDAALAIFLQQELRCEGGEAVTRPGLRHGQPEKTDVLLMGTLKQLRHLIVRLRTLEDEPVRNLAADLEAALNAYHSSARKATQIGPRLYEWGVRTYIMGIVNITPDSFSGDGLLKDTTDDWSELALAHAERLVDEGADIIDVGGESTRPGATPVSLDEELRRVLPVIERLARQVEIPISIDTYKAEVARRALDSGAHLVNDVWGGRMDSGMLPLVAARGVPMVLVHNGRRPKDRALSERSESKDAAASASHSEQTKGRSIERPYLIASILRELRERIQAALDAGVKTSQIIVDPGIGFGKTVEYNLELMRRLDELRVLGYPILIGPSRKAFVDYTLDLPPQERIDGTAAAVVLGIAAGVDLVRVHDVRAMVRAARLADAVVRRDAG